jgi:hypothetical protein
MKTITVALLMICGAVLHAQERTPPKDSTRISVTGCTKGSSLTAALRPGTEPVSGLVQPGRRFRLLGPKELISEIKKQEGRFVEVTGLVRIAELSPSTRGVPVGGRVRVGGGPPNQDPLAFDPRRAPDGGEVVMDVESWRPWPESCPSKKK